MRFFLSVILLGVSVLGFSQSSPREYLYEKAVSLYKSGNVQQARYHYLLALKQKGEQPSDESIKNEVVKLDSIEAYGSGNAVFVDLLERSDSLFFSERYIEAMKFYDDASSLEPAFDYPYARIDQIIGASKEIKKKLLIYNAKQNQLSYAKSVKEIEMLEASGYEIEAYFKYVELARAFHGDTLGEKRSEKLRLKHQEHIDELLALMLEADELYIEGKPQKALLKYEKALEVNPKCKTCEYRVEQLKACIKLNSGEEESFDTSLEEARDSFKVGEYQKSYYQFSWLEKQRPDNIEVRTYIEKLEELIQSETDDRMKKFNADLTLEKANDAFLQQNYEDALSKYLTLKNAYSESIDYLQFVELRILECLNELED